MLYLMLGTIIFLLTFCALGSVTPDAYKDDAHIMGWVVNIFLAIILGGIYYFFLR